MNKINIKNKCVLKENEKKNKERFLEITKEQAKFILDNYLKFVR